MAQDRSCVIGAVQWDGLFDGPPRHIKRPDLLQWLPDRMQRSVSLGSPARCSHLPKSLPRRFHFVDGYSGDGTRKARARSARMSFSASDYYDRAARFRRLAMQIGHLEHQRILFWMAETCESLARQQVAENTASYFPRFYLRPRDTSLVASRGRKSPLKTRLVLSWVKD